MKEWCHNCKYGDLLFEDFPCNKCKFPWEYDHLKTGKPSMWGKK